jgi:hypothetical protein|tara:strand:- start:574 stop:924 length:351 start_codon:yes stop_codon:yes gene_type:complete
MQDTGPDGTITFRCDFCRAAWDEDLAMVEGHRGAIICGRCLSVAYAELVHLRSDRPCQPGEKCVLCLEENRPDAHWESPGTEGVLACKRCIKQAAGVLHKDKDIAWTKPPDPRDAV